ncbi:MAG: diphosphomevalonate decarboxylase [Candidatus Bathyarchaeia archaeon]
MKASAIAHPIQGLVKYHGLKKPKYRIPFHDSISVCIDALHTTTTVEAHNSIKANNVLINGRRVVGHDKERIETVLNKFKRLAKYRGFFKVVSQNSVERGKGLGFSASGFAALAVATSKALDLELDYVTLSETARLGAGSATRSLAGGFALWHADKNGHSYAEQLSTLEDVNFSMVIVPIFSETKTDEAHVEVVSSPLFQARLKTIKHLIKIMKTAITKGDIAKIGQLAEEDTLNLHAITMTGKSRLILWEPDTIRLIREVNKLRNNGIECWYSIDTGPSVFVNTFKEYTSVIAGRFADLGFSNIIISGIGDKPKLVDGQLF